MRSFSIPPVRGIATGCPRIISSGRSTLTRARNRTHEARKRGEAPALRECPSCKQIMAAPPPCAPLRLGGTPARTRCRFSRRRAGAGKRRQGKAVRIQHRRKAQLVQDARRRGAAARQEPGWAQYLFRDKLATKSRPPTGLPCRRHRKCRGSCSRASSLTPSRGGRQHGHRIPARLLGVEHARAKAWLADIDALGIALRGGLITPAQAAEHMREMDLLSLAACQAGRTEMSRRKTRADWRRSSPPTKR